MERPEIAPFPDRDLGFPGRRKGPIGQKRDKALEAAVELIDAIQLRPHEIDRRQLPCADEGGGLCGSRESRDYAPSSCAGGLDGVAPPITAGRSG